MKTNLLQRTAEEVLDLEIQIFHWQGSNRKWSGEISRLGGVINELISSAEAQNDPVQEAFLRDLRCKINTCRDCITNRARWMNVQCDPGSFHESGHAVSGVLSGMKENNDNRKGLNHGND